MSHSEESKSKSGYVFPGFGNPAYTPVPDILFDELVSELSESELKVLLYIMRRTFGFKKNADDISIKQMAEGIVTKDGRRLDRGAGISQSSAIRGVKGLVEKGIVVVSRNRTKASGDVASTYELRFSHQTAEATPVSQFDTGGDAPVSQFDRPSPVSQIETLPSFKLREARLSNSYTQETVEQKTVDQETVRIVDYSKKEDITFSYSETRTALQPYVEDLAREFLDQAKLPSSVTRMVNLCKQSGLELNDFIDVMMAARAKTKEYSASIKSVPEGERWGKKNRMAYFYSVLEDMLDLKRNKLSSDL